MKSGLKQTIQCQFHHIYQLLMLKNNDFLHPLKTGILQETSNSGGIFLLPEHKRKHDVEDF